MSEASTTISPVAPLPVAGSERSSVQAVITYWLIANLTLTGAAVFLLVVFQVKVDPVLLGVLGGFILNVSSLASGAVGFWLGATARSNQTPAAVTATASSPPQSS